MRRLFAIALGLMASSCSPGSGPVVGGETHWLAVCSKDRDCGGDGLHCICGTCTKACAGDEACQGGQCYDSKSPLLLQRCDELQAEALPAICLAQCETDVDCGSGRGCEQGACVPGQSSVRISDFADASDEVSWSEPVVTLPELDALEGVTPDVLGTWREADCDPAHPPMRAANGCLSIELVRAGASETRGWVRVERTSGDVLGPFEPARDPDVGYPRELKIDQYKGVTGLPLPDVDYRVLNGRMSGDRLMFNWNLFDVWRDWCALQRPYRWTVAERSMFFCVPQDAAQQALLDEGKVVLCRSADFEPVCGDGTMKLPCSCVDLFNPRCSSTVCACDSERCGIPAVSLSAELSFASDRASAVLKVLGYPIGVEVTLRRSVP